MIRDHSSRQPESNRPGKTLVMFALLLPVLLGMIGLSIDSGLLMASYRQTQNAADAAALGAALDLYNGKSIATAQATGTIYVHTYNNMSGATVAINIPPLTGPHAGSGNTTYAEAVISFPYKTSFIQLLGVNKNQAVTARAVAGSHATTPAEGIMTLTQHPPGGAGLTVAGSSILTVGGAIVDNATGSGALAINGSNSRINATKVSVSGGYSGNANAIQTYSSGGELTPLSSTGVDYADPYASLPVPTTSNGVINTYYGTSLGLLVLPSASPQDVNITSGITLTLQPGIYGSISIQGGAIVTFAPGIYVLAGTKGLTIAGNATVIGSGVMFYNTADVYTPSTGVLGCMPQFGPISISGGTAFNLSGISNPSSPYYGMLVFQDRSNTQGLTISGNSTSLFSGTWYAPTASFTLSGGSTFNSQFIVGSMTVTGGSSSVVLPPVSLSNLVYLVE